MPWINLITQLGDLAVLLPLALMLITVLWLSDNRRVSLYLSIALFGCLGTMALLKLFFLTCGSEIGVSIASPSGHAAASTLVLGSLCTVVCYQLHQRRRIVAMIATFFAVAAIAVSRVALGAHSAIEVVIGATTGAVYLGGFATACARVPHPRLNVGQLALGVLLILIVLYGSHLPIEILLRQSANMLRTGATTCF